jgi:hypothetical protein
MSTKYTIIEYTTGKVVAHAKTWEEAYAKRDELQKKSLDAGVDLTQQRYALRCD